jgi:hypothetical protein
MASKDDDRSAVPKDKGPTLRQRLHAATGDRDAEARALEAQTNSDVTETDARVAVQRAHGEAGSDQPSPEAMHPDEALALPADAEAVHDERTADS